MHVCQHKPKSAGDFNFKCRNSLNTCFIIITFLIRLVSRINREDYLIIELLSRVACFRQGVIIYLQVGYLIIVLELTILYFSSQRSYLSGKLHVADTGCCYTIYLIINYVHIPNKGLIGRILILKNNVSFRFSTNF